MNTLLHTQSFRSSKHSMWHCSPSPDSHVFEDPDHGCDMHGRCMDAHCMHGVPACRGSLPAVKLEACVDGEEAFTLVLDDPSGNSYIESPGDTHGSKDPLLRLERYERTPEQAAGIGLLPPEPAGERLCVRWCQSLSCSAHA